MRMYKLSKTNFEEYQRQVIKEQDAENASLQKAIAARERDDIIKPECPYCHSHNTCKITEIEKAINTAIVGVYGQKRKYQWYCYDCRSDF